MLIRFILLRFFQTILTLLLILTLFFFVARFAIGHINFHYIITEYLTYLKNIFNGNLGVSLYGSRPVSGIFLYSLSNTLALAVPSFIFSMIIAFGLGITGAVNKDTCIDKGVKFLSVIGISIPPFWFAIMLIFLFTMYWQIFPIYSRINKITSLTYVLPLSAMIFLNFPITMRLVRSAMREELAKEYIKLARIKGLPERTIVLKHALKNALIIPLTSAGMLFSFIMAGSIIVENVFLWPGLGNMALNALGRGDYPLLQVYILFLTGTLLLINFFVDVTYAVIDPQIRYGKH